MWSKRTRFLLKQHSTPSQAGCGPIYELAHALMLSSILLAIALGLTSPSRALDNGVGRTPAMGWNSYNAFSCGATETQYQVQARALVDLGLKDLGYQYLNLDCGWQGTSRNASGGFTWNTERFPSGIPALASFVHDLGLKFGVYSDDGYYSCDDQGGNAHWQGSLDHEEQDAASFAEWGADYLKYDNCFAVSKTDFVNYDPPFEPRYTKMRDALAATGRPILYSACNWGVQDPARTWPGPTVANSWRMSNDIGPPATWASVFRILNQVVPITGFAEPGGFNDLDMLYVGNSGLTPAEQQTHFAFWAAAKSPLLIGIDLTKAGSSALNILKNERVIAINQDSLGKSISFKRRYINDHDVWAGPLSDGSAVVLVINLQTLSRTVALNLADVGFSSANAQDIITGHDLGMISNSYEATLEGHGSFMLKLTSGTPVPPPEFTFYDASSGDLSGGANTRSVNDTIVVGFVGNGGKITLNNVDGGSEGGTKLLALDYINAEFTMTNTACPNCREAILRVNGGEEARAQMPISGQSWDIAFRNYLVSVPGFRAGRTNTLEIYNPSAYTPDFVRIGVAV
ncbi:glycoside hydrolase family 27 protein [Moniliophthora roreri]|nr:glycoside hydrolase family 27 protein [Moniliophthora roreri]